MLVMKVLGVILALFILSSRHSPAAKPIAASTQRSRRKPKDPNIPTVPFGTDLLHWGEENIEVPLVVRYVKCFPQKDKEILLCQRNRSNLN